MEKFPVLTLLEDEGAGCRLKHTIAKLASSGEIDGSVQCLDGFPAKRLMSFHNFGYRSLKKLQDILIKHGMSLGGPPDPLWQTRTGVSSDKEIEELKRKFRSLENRFLDFQSLVKKMMSMSNNGILCPTQTGLVDVDAASAFLGLSKDMLYRRLHRGEIRHVKIGDKCLRFRLEDLEEFVAEHVVEPKKSVED